MLKGNSNTVSIKKCHHLIFLFSKMLAHVRTQVRNSNLKLRSASFTVVMSSKSFKYSHFLFAFPNF